jgi:hypothetical protein
MSDGKDQDAKGSQHNGESASSKSPPSIEPEPVDVRDGKRLQYLSANRGLIVKRSLLATLAGGAIPIPVVDDYVASRVRAGLLMKLAEQRHVDLPQSSAELMGDPREGSALRNATLTAITLVALKLAWRKIFALLAAGRGAEEMVNTFQFAVLFDHYCAKLHVGAGIDRQRASDLRALIHQTVDRTEKAALVAVFRDGSRILGRSLLEAPRWLTTRLGTLAQRWTSTRGDVAATFDPAADVAASGQTQWLDRASAAIEERLALLGTDYLSILIEDFDKRWADRPPPSDAAAAPADGKPAAAAPPEAGTPGGAPGEQPGKPPDKT